MTKNSSIKIRRALLSVSDKTGIIDLANSLQKKMWKLFLLEGLYNI